MKARTMSLFTLSSRDARIWRLGIYAIRWSSGNADNCMDPEARKRRGLQDDKTKR